MNSFYVITFAVLAICTAILERCKAASGKAITGNKSFQAFRNNYILVYSLMMGACRSSGLRASLTRGAPTAPCASP
jgi:Sugar-tranasporters, 12 TM